MHLVPSIQGRGFEASEACGVLFLSRVAFGKLADMIGGSVWTNATAAIAVVITLIIVGSLWATINRRPLAVAG